MKDMFEGAFGFAMIAFFAVVYFPGGTILMALSCNTNRLDGWDWVGSVVIPGYGLIKALFSSAC